MVVGRVVVAAGVNYWHATDGANPGQSARARRRDLLPTRIVRRCTRECAGRIRGCLGWRAECTGHVREGVHERVAGSTPRARTGPGRRAAVRPDRATGPRRYVGGTCGPGARPLSTFGGRPFLTAPKSRAYAPGLAAKVKLLPLRSTGLEWKAPAQSHS